MSTAASSEPSPAAPATPELSKRVQAVSPSITLAVSNKAKSLRSQGIDVVSFGAGEPDFNTPTFIKDAAKEALNANMTRYSTSNGIPALREVIAEKFQKDNALPYGPEQIMVGPGGKGVLYFAMLALLNDGDEVLMPTPYWVSYPEQAKLCGGVPTFVEGDESRDFKLTPEQLDAAITEKTKIFILNSPSNPAGNCYSPEELTALGKVLEKHPQVTVFSDEIYEKLLYDGQQTASIAALVPSLQSRTITFNCHSKTYAMTGWRIGYLAAPADFVESLTEPRHTLSINTCTISQHAALAALTGPQDEVEGHFAAYAERRAYLMEAASALGLRYGAPGGAFYLYTDVSSTGLSGAAFCEALLRETGVLIFPGDLFGDPGSDFVRISYLQPLPRLREAMERIGGFMRSVEAA